ncbi:hypothetical protein J6590_031990 [Homalodisca vitripennis]|nr:hypothetical protein J6590_031990 [Homalodisca vitripennis]
MSFVKRCARTLVERLVVPEPRAQTNYFQCYKLQLDTITTHIPASSMVLTPVYEDEWLHSYLSSRSQCVQVQNTAYYIKAVISTDMRKELGSTFEPNSIEHEHMNASLLGLNPTPNENDGVLAATWLPVNGSFTQHLVINDSLEMINDYLLHERMNLWETLFNLQGSSQDDTSIGLKIMEVILALAFLCLLYLLYDSSCTRGLRGKRYESL